MTPDRFSQLCEAYGADIRRWPAGERDAATAYAASNPAARQMLDSASGLDRLLDTHAVPLPAAALRERIVASGPRAAWHWARLAWRSAGLAGLGLAGAVAGALLVAIALTPQGEFGTDDGYAVTAFDFSADSDLGAE
jgi:hypothetical protein